MKVGDCEDEARSEEQSDELLVAALRNSNSLAPIFMQLTTLVAASQQPFGHRKSKYGAGARDSIASIRQEAKKQGYRRMTLEVKKVREVAGRTSGARMRMRTKRTETLKTRTLTHHIVTPPLAPRNGA